MVCQPNFGLPLTMAQYAGYIVTGAQDSIINIWDIGQSREEPLYSLLGHSGNVCALHVGGDGSIISGSWDKYALLSSIRPTKLTPLCEGLPKCGLTFSLCTTSWATRSLCGQWYQWKATSISLVRSFPLLSFSYDISYPLPQALPTKQ